MIADAADHALMDSRVAIAGLTQPSLGGAGASIAEHVRALAKRWNVDVQVDVVGDVQVPTAKHAEVLRIVGEAITNAARHAEATTVSVHIGGQDGRLLVSISDDGRGFDAAHPGFEYGFGLHSMQERAALLGGDVQLASTPGSGTRVDIAIP
jgi:signal transduction histidine kinase